VLLTAMAESGVHRLILASSMVVYGEGAYRCPQHGPGRPQPRRPADLDAGRFEVRCPTGDAWMQWTPVDELAPIEPRSTYAATKAAQEHLAAAWQRDTGADVIALRYHNVYGPGMPRDTPYAGVAAIFRSQLQAGRAPEVFEDGAQVRDFVHVDDVARANVLAVARVATGEFTPVNIASGTPIAVLEMARVIADAYGGPQPLTTGRYRSGDVRHVVASPHRALRELGFTASVNPTIGLTEFAHAPLRAASGTTAANAR